MSRLRLYALSQAEIASFSFLGLFLRPRGARNVISYFCFMASKFNERYLVDFRRERGKTVTLHSSGQADDAEGLCRSWSPHGPGGGVILERLAGSTTTTSLHRSATDNVLVLRIRGER